jgi:hypothetical protein
MTYLCGPSTCFIEKNLLKCSHWENILGILANKTRRWFIKWAKMNDPPIYSEHCSDCETRTVPTEPNKSNMMLTINKSPHLACMVILDFRPTKVRVCKAIWEIGEAHNGPELPYHARILRYPTISYKFLVSCNLSLGNICGTQVSRSNPQYTVSIHANTYRYIKPVDRYFKVELPTYDFDLFLKLNLNVLLAWQQIATTCKHNYWLVHTSYEEGSALSTGPWLTHPAPVSPLWIFGSVVC